jgi:hypothetical protein
LQSFVAVVFVVAVAIVFVVAVILNAVKDPRRTPFTPTARTFQPHHSRSFCFEASPREHEIGPAKNKVEICGMFLAAK